MGIATTPCCASLFEELYRTYLSQSSSNISFVERRVSGEPAVRLSAEGESRNEPSLYSALFSGSCLAFVEQMYSEAMSEMKALPYDASQDVLSALALIQDITATALWKYHCDAGKTLESFAREFDRLDVESERRRLHVNAVSM